MQIVQGSINDRQVFYFDIGNSLDEIEQIELESWVTFIIVDDVSHPLLKRFADIAIDKGLQYMSATGHACSEVDDLFDSLMVKRMIGGMNLPSWFRNEDDVLMTTWHQDFKEGYWFITTVATYGDIPIKSVVVVNFTQTSRFNDIQELSESIQSGHYP